MQGARSLGRTPAPGQGLVGAERQVWRQLGAPAVLTTSVVLTVVAAFARPAPAAGKARLGDTKLGCVANSSGEAASTGGEPAFPWPAGSATGVGSLPGTDSGEAMRLVFGELPELPHLAELPGRGPGADLTGRTAALLIDLPVETVPGGWRFTSRPGRDLNRARGMLSSDLDALEEAASGYKGPLKIQVCGPWTMAAAIELAHRQDPALADAGAVADLTASLAEGVRAHVEEVRKRAPGARVLLQLDEPALPAVLAGQVPTASGLNRLPAVPAPEAESALRSIMATAQAFTIIHCCALSVPFGIIRGAGADAVSFDLALLRGGEDDLAETVEAGLGILAGVVATSPGGRRRTAGGGSAADGLGAADRGRPGAGGPGAGGPGAGGPGAGRPAPFPGGSTRGGGLAASGRNRASGVPGQPPVARDVAGEVIEVWRRMGWPSARGGSGSAGPQGVPAQVVLTPACGLAGASPAYARAALARCREAARILPELIEVSR